MVKRVVIAGGGVAALEAALALRSLAKERVAIELFGSEPHFWYRPLSVAEPFELGEAHRYELSALAAAAGATFTLATLQGVDASRRAAMTSVGAIPYDVLLVAVGVVPTLAVPGALTFRGPADTDKFRELLEEIAAGDVRRLAFVVPWGVVWSLPLYELALLTSGYLEAHRIEGVELVLITPEQAPLELFGRTGSKAIGDLLDERGVELMTSTYPTDFVGGKLGLVPDGQIEVDRVVALPRLRGPSLDGLPQTLEGFIPTDMRGRVSGLEDVYAAGDITNFPIKQGGIATQLARVAAETIASELGADVEPEPFRPVLRGLLLTGGQPRYLRRELTGIEQSETVGNEPLWWPPAKIVGRHLAPFLANFAGLANPKEAADPEGSIRVEVELGARQLEQLGALPLQTLDGTGRTVGEAMSTDLLVVASDTALVEVAQTMRERDVGAAAVADDNLLIGILTSGDLRDALAARVQPSMVVAREWMTAEPVVVAASTRIEVAVTMMNEHGIDQLLVVDGQRPIGVLGYRQACDIGSGS